MATKLKNYTFGPPSRLSTGEKAVYPWDDWFDGDVWQIEQGDDFEGHPLMMERIIRTRATGRKAKVQLRHVARNGDQWGTIVLQRTDVDGPQQTKKRAANEKRAATKAAKANGTKLAEVTPITAAKKPAAKKTASAAKASASKTPSKRPAKKAAVAAR